jgi:drug/metabolite transporter (DMT)-like permease
MVTPALAFALLAGASMATYILVSRLAAGGIHPVLGAAVITGAAFVVNAAVLVAVRAAGGTLTASGRSVALLAIVGAAAACADVFTLSAYARGLQATSSLVIGGTSTVLVVVVGFLILREPFTWGKLLALALIAGGIALLQREGL